MAVILDNRIQRSEDALVILSFSEEDKYAPRNSFLHGDMDYIYLVINQLLLIILSVYQGNCNKCDMRVETPASYHLPQSFFTLVSVLSTLGYPRFELASCADCLGYEAILFGAGTIHISPCCVIFA